MDNGDMAFSRAELESFRGGSVDPLVGEGIRLLFVGINPGLWTAATNTPFAHPGNRFFPALRAAGIFTEPLDFSRGMTDAERSAFTARGLGISNLVNRATVRADELSREELRAGARRLEQNVARWRPLVVAVVGLTAYRQGFDRPKAVQGLQAEPIAGAQLWAVPNPSGLNAHETVPSLAEAYAQPARAAGIL